jgi:hypothetical protein
MNSINVPSDQEQFTSIALLAAWCQSPGHLDARVRELDGERARQERAQAEINSAWAAHREAATSAELGVREESASERSGSGGGAATLIAELGSRRSSLRDRIDNLKRVLRSRQG